jgi:hypothetical protein
MSSEITSAQDWFYVFPKAESEGGFTVMRVAVFERSKAVSGNTYVVGLVAVEEHGFQQARFVEPPKVPGGHYRHLSQLTPEQVEASKTV